MSRVPTVGGDRNKVGTAYSLIVFTAIVPGHEPAVKAAIEGLPRGTDGPWARFERVHAARLQIYDQPVYQGAPQKPERLRSSYLSTAIVDGDRDPFLDEICERMPAEAESWWGHCVGYPGVADRAAFRRWIVHNQIETALVTSPYPTASVQDVRESLALRERVVEFAIAAQGLDAAELQQRFRQAFSDVR